MEMSLVAGFWMVSFLLIMTPGADWAYTISAGIHGQRIIPAVAGLMSGHLLATLVVVAGLGVLIAGHPLALSAITLLGACYFTLAWDFTVAPSGDGFHRATAQRRLESVGIERIVHQWLKSKGLFTVSSAAAAVY
ncbi:LysE type translocator [Kluyvera cryocrescens]|uniref:LysE type translocator n=1 Tax=Kluyvera cryocrescens TaxID=580 RepID=A0A485ASX0_KLUCR|nr:LysE type translocator [Kluyvera cryocrescens]